MNSNEKQIDIIEDDIARIDPRLLEILLKDKTTGANILWCTTDYEEYGPEYGEHSQILSELITCNNSCVIQPRAAKPKAIQDMRAKKHAEVFTPSWICNAQNNQVDEVWFGRTDVFNTPCGSSWITTPGCIEFSGTHKTWKNYVDAKRLEITCGEAPYLVSRYDTTTGAFIPVYERVGLFDRKMRIVNENCPDDESWLEWSTRALWSVYGYEFQGDNLLIARENLLYDYMDYYKDRFGSEPPIRLLKKIANIIAWNIWQMDGLKFVVPYSCHPIEFVDNQVSMFETEGKKVMKPCQGCENDDITQHNGVYCRIYDWIGVKKSILFISLMQGGAVNGTI